MPDITHQQILDAITGLETSITSLDTRITSVETSITGLSTRMTGLETGMTSIETRLTTAITDAKKEIINGANQQFESIAENMVTHQDLTQELAASERRQATLLRKATFHPARPR